MLNTLLRFCLYLHIFSGGTALVSGFIALANAKGMRIHRTAGKIFFIAMNFVSASALIISIAKKNDFLLAIAVFSFYMNYTGYRALKNKTVRFTWYDWLPLVFSAATAAYMLYTRNIVLMVFGTILASMIIRDIIKQRKTDEELKSLWRLRVLDHISRMVGTYIATTTAFVVVNINFVKPWWLMWLLPTALGVPFIIYWSRRWQLKLTPSK